MIKYLIKKILKTDTEIIFVSHPFSNSAAENRAKADKICRELYAEGCFVISPLHLFSFFPDARHRKSIMMICKHLIIICNEVYFYNYNGLSPGQVEEYTFACKLRKKYKIIKMSEERRK